MKTYIFIDCKERNYRMQGSISIWCVDGNMIMKIASLGDPQSSKYREEDVYPNDISVKATAEEYKKAFPEAMIIDVTKHKDEAFSEYNFIWQNLTGETNA